MSWFRRSRQSIRICQRLTLDADNDIRMIITTIENSWETANMISETAFPDWIEEDLPQIKSTLVPKIRERLDTCREEFQSLVDILFTIPKGEDAPVPEVSKDGLGRLPGPFGPTLYSCRYWIEQWYYRHACKLKAYLCGLRCAMESGNWLVGASCLRNAYEEVIYFDYHLRTVHECVRKVDELGKAEDIKGKKKGKLLRKWVGDYTQLHLKL